MLTSSILPSWIRQSDNYNGNDGNNILINKLIRRQYELYLEMYY